jgi:two-component system, OmpR family, phosphate regulon response regulator PhoB
MKKFLVCEDDQDMVDFLDFYLTSKGFDFMIVEEGRMVLPALKENSFSFLLLDLNLPDMHGKDVIRQIREDPSIKDLPIVIFSASLKTKQLVEELDVQGYIEKPFELEDLEKVIIEKAGAG